MEKGPGDETTGGKVSAAHFLKVFFICLGLWAAVFGGVVFFFGFDSTLSAIVLFFTKAAFITFGGAYAVLSYITDTAVAQGWVTAGQMVMGLGLAESTPGPLIMVTQFVGFIGAWSHPEGLSPIPAGILGALLTTYSTFLPCFFFIFAGAPFIEAMAANRHLQAALTGVTSAVVGVVLNLAVFFGTKVILPGNSGLDYFALAGALISFWVIQKFHIPIQYMVLLGVLAGMGRHFVLI